MSHWQPKFRMRLAAHLHKCGIENADTAQRGQGSFKDFSSTLSIIRERTTAIVRKKKRSKYIRSIVNTIDSGRQDE